MNWAMLLAMCGGGTYSAEAGLSRADWEHDSEMGERAYGRRGINIPSGATRRDIERLLDMEEMAVTKGTNDIVADFWKSLSADDRRTYLDRLPPPDQKQFLELIQQRSKAAQPAGGH